jgi:hypothetical protein
LQVGAEFNGKETKSVDRGHSKMHYEYRLKVYNCLWVIVKNIAHDKKLQSCSFQCSSKPSGMKGAYPEITNI